jgi:two-component system sensor histidine kinase KdpD
VKTNWSRVIAGALLAAATTAIAAPLGVDSTIAALLLLSAVIGASLLGRLSGAAAALVAFFSFNFFFTKPYHSLAIHNRDDVIAFIVFAAAAFVLGSIVARLNELRVQADRRAGETRLRLDLTNRLRAGDAPEPVAQAAADALVALFDLTSCTVTSEALGLAVVSPPNASPAASRAAENAAVSSVGGLSIIATSAAGPLSADDQALLDALVAGLAASLDRIRLEDEAREASIAAAIGRTRSGFLSAITHNLRTPLAAMHASASTLLDTTIDLPPTDRQELLETVRDETVRLEHLVTNVLEISRIRAGGLEPHPEPVSLTDLAQGAVRRLKTLAADHRMTLEVQDELPDVLVDISMLDQVFLNLLENALRFAPSGTEIAIRAHRVGAHAELRVIDHGPGIPEADRERIFEEFVRLSEGDDSTGTGLGLAIARTLVQLHGGTLWCEETPGGGATFVCTLPLETMG